MSLPTAHNYIVENLKKNITSIEEKFLNPSLLIEELISTEKGLSEGIEIFAKDSLSKNVIGDKKEEIVAILKKIEELEKKSQEKLIWAVQFSKYLQNHVETK